MSVRLVAGVLEANGLPAEFVEATQVIVTDRHFGAAHPDMEATRVKARQVIDPLLSQGKTAVVTGFIGATAGGVPTTLGRGGSDTSAVAIAAAIHADRCDIYTDVDGVYTTDPRVVPKARRLDRIAFEDMLELASQGAKVLQVRSVELGMVHKDYVIGKEMVAH